MVGQNKAVALLATAEITYVSQSRSDPHAFSSWGPQECKANMLHTRGKGPECIKEGVSSFHHCQGLLINRLSWII